METIKTGINWIDYVIPEGLPLKSTIVSNTTKTYIFAVSTSAKVEEISQLEEIADNLIMSRSEKRLLD